MRYALGKSSNCASFTLPHRVDEGARHDVIFRLASSMRSKDASEQAALAAALAENEARFNPPCSYEEVNAIVADVYRRYAGGLSEEYAVKKRGSTCSIINRSDSIDMSLIDRFSSMDAFGKYTHDDKGFGRLFADVNESRHRYNVTSKEWLFYDGRVWRRDVGGMMVSKEAKRFSDSLLVYATSIADSDERLQYQKTALKYGQLRYRKALIEDSASEHYVSADDLDKHDDLYNCKNGTVDLSTGELLPHKPENLLTKISQVFDPDAESHLWLNSINEIMQGDSEKISYMQRVFGYALTASTSEEAAFFFVGLSTRNGKTSVLETMRYMHGGDKGIRAPCHPTALL